MINAPNTDLATPSTDLSLAPVTDDQPVVSDMDSEVLESLLPTRILDNYFQVPFTTFLQPLSPASPCGDYLRFHEIYQRISDARHYEDESLPQGIWNRELKRADWPAVSQQAIAALQEHSKDLQLAVWLTEAEIHQYYFNALAPCFNLLTLLCQTFWQTIHPEPVDNDIEYRINPITWLVDKIQPVIHLLPITQSSRLETQLSWSDWITANKNQQLLREHGDPERVEGVTVDDFNDALAATSSDHLLDIAQALHTGLQAINGLIVLLQQLCTEEAPSGHYLIELLGSINSFINAEIEQRGISPAQTASPAQESIAFESSLARHVSTTLNADQTLTSRSQAYGALHEAASLLKTIEPHSPAPYLVLAACKWGTMDTRELYRELFIQNQGQINIFDLLGVPAEAVASTAGANE